jgi:hypothetical protein
MRSAPGSIPVRYRARRRRHGAPGLRSPTYAHDERGRRSMGRSHAEILSGRAMSPLHRSSARTRGGALCIRAALDFGRRRRERGARRGQGVRMDATRGTSRRSSAEPSTGTFLGSQDRRFLRTAEEPSTRPSASGSSTRSRRSCSRMRTTSRDSGGRTRRALGEREEVRRAAQPFFEPDASGRLAQRGRRS